MAIVPTMHKKPLYNSVTDFTAAGLVVEQPIVLITRKDLPVNNLQEFVAYAKANHEKMQLGSSGVGSGSHFSCAKLNKALDRSDARALRARACHAGLIGGRIDYFCALGAAAMGPLEGGNAKAMALLTSALAFVPNAANVQGARTTRNRLLLLDGVLFPQGHARRHRSETL